MNLSTQSLIPQRIKCFVDFIAPECEESSKIKEHFQQVEVRVEKRAKEAEIFNTKPSPLINRVIELS